MVDVQPPMQRGRVVSIVEDTWGKGMIFTDESLKNLQQITSETEGLPSQEMIVEEIAVLTSDVRVEESEDSPKKKCLTYLESSMFATALEDIITELRILDTINNELHIHKTMSDMPLLRALKYDVEQPPHTDELEGIDHKNLGCMKYKLKKLFADRKYLFIVLTTLYTEMAVNKTFECLKKSVQDVIDREEYMAVLEVDEAKNKIARRELNKQLRQQRNHIKSVVYDTDATIDNLNFQVEDAVLVSECRSRYVDNWQRARTEQNTETIKDVENVPYSSIEYYKRRYDHEQRVHGEVELLCNIMINETLSKVESWMEKYDKDMEAIDLKIQIKKNNYQNERDRRIELEDTIEKHDQLMKDWVYFKDEREKARLYREKMTNAALTVQAWWRGLLVRLQLGPYKVSKKRGGGKKK